MCVSINPLHSNSSSSSLTTDSRVKIPTHSCDVVANNKSLIETFVARCKKEYGEDVVNWAFPTADQEEVTSSPYDWIKNDEEIFEANMALKKDSKAVLSLPKSDEELNSWKKKTGHIACAISLSNEPSTRIESIIQSTHPSAPIAALGCGLFNSRVDCFINSVLQLFKALKLTLPASLSTSCAYFSSFLNNTLQSTPLSCMVVRSEIAKHVLENSSLDGIAKFGNASSQQDAQEFASLLLAKSEAPEVIMEESTTHEGQLTKSPEFLIKGALLSLPIPVRSAMEAMTMKKIISHSLTEEIDTNTNGIGAPRMITQTRKLITAPNSFVAHIGRFANQQQTNNDGTPVYNNRGQTITALFKRHDAITDIFEPIELPLEDGRTVYYKPVAMVLHHGELDGGHYTTLCKDEAGHWNYFDDDNVTANIDMQKHNINDTGHWQDDRTRNGYYADEANQKQWVDLLPPTIHQVVASRCYLVAYHKIEEPDITNSSAI